MKATICDVGPREGLQNEPEPLSVPARAELVKGLAAVGVPRIEAASFVHPERVPQTGIDLEGLIAVAAWLEETLGRELPGQVYRAGTFAPVAG